MKHFEAETPLHCTAHSVHARRPYTDGVSQHNDQHDPRDEIRAAALRAAAELRDASIPAEGLATYEPPRRVLFWTRPARMRPRGLVWRVGVLMLGTDGAVYAAGRHTRAAERGRPGYQSVSREERRGIAAAALRGGYAVGTPVNFDAMLLVTAQPDAAPTKDAFGPDSPLGFVGNEVRVRWSPSASLETGPAFATYLAERVSLLIEPPFSTTD